MKTLPFCHGAKRPSPPHCESRPGRAHRSRASAGLLAAMSLAIFSAFALSMPRALASADDSAETARLADEVRNKGWIIYGARAPAGDWDLYLCRPDGSSVTNLTSTPDLSEFSPQFSRDGRKLLYRRVRKNEPLDDNHHGEQGLIVIANSNGTDPRTLGKPGEFPWASWSPDARQLACLSIRGIFFVDAASGETIGRMPRQGFFQQLTWSPDGRWLLGVANSLGVSWSIGRLQISNPRMQAVNRVDCCTPDWFPDSRAVIFSWRPPGQRTNRGYGWTQLWRANADGTGHQLVFAEDGRHIYGGHVSPDGLYVIFTGNSREAGDPRGEGGPIGLMRLRNAPIIHGASPAVRALHPDALDGPVLTLPNGWEPAWTFSELPNLPTDVFYSTTPADHGEPNENPATQKPVDQLSAELRGKGWIVFSAKTSGGDWDLFRIRPDGTDRRQLTRTPRYNEAGARFSPDGLRMLYYRMPKSEPVDNNTYGTFDLIISDANGEHARFYGSDFPWASWSPDGRQVACLTTSGIEIINLKTANLARRIQRHGIVQQLVWSPDGRSFTGTANGLGPYWNVASLEIRTGLIKLVSEFARYNCTPDWWPDSRQIVYARGIVPQAGGRAELWIGTVDGRRRRPLYVEAGRHIYGACPSPDGNYLVFTRSVEDLGRVDNSSTTMAIIRQADTPMVGDADPELRDRLPNATLGPRLDLGAGWEPHWTFAEIPGYIPENLETRSRPDAGGAE